MTGSDPQPTASAYSYPLLLRHLLRTPLTLADGREIVHDGRRHDYPTFAARVARLAAALSRLGVRRGDTVAVMDWDSHRYLECFFAVPMLGAVLHTINIRLAPEQVLYTIEHARDDLLLVHPDFLPLLGEIAARITVTRRVLLLAETSAAPADGLQNVGEYETLLAAEDDDFAVEDFDENTRATTFYTTGTTGDPKGVWYTHRQLVVHTLGVLAGINAGGAHGTFTREDVYMPLTPMFHVHAWGVPYVASMLGVKQVYPGRYTPENILRLIAEEGVTFSHCVPTILHMLLECPASREVDLSGWKVIIGGSALPRGLALAALERGIDVYGGYGLSETCPILTTALLSRADLEATPEAQLERRTKAGRPLPLVDLRVVDEAMQPQPHDGESTGEVVVRAPWLTQGYLGDAPRSEQLWQDGWLHTGDIGHIDAHGYLKVTDRVKDVIKSGGEWISSIAIEDVVSGVAGVAECAVIGVADERWGERPLVLVRGIDGADTETLPGLVRDAITAEVKAGRLSRWAVPERVMTVTAIARTSVGKIDKKRLRAEYG